MAGGLLFQCNSCRELVNAAAFVLAEGATRAGVVCPSCGLTSWLSAAEPGAPATEAEAPSPFSMAPPTAAAPSTPAPSSSSSVSSVAGALAAAAAASPTSSASTPLSPPALTMQPPEPPAPLTAPLSPAGGTFDTATVDKVRERLDKTPPAPSQLALRQRFEALLSSPSWSSEADHKKLLKSAALEGELAFVGGCYRAVLDVVRDEARAKGAQQELLTLAMATMSTQKDLGTLQEQSGPSSTKVLAIAVLLGAMVVGGLLLAKKMVADMGSMSQTDQ